jgi:hypothetical protein
MLKEKQLSWTPNSPRGKKGERNWTGTFVSNLFSVSLEKRREKTCLSSACPLFLPANYWRNASAAALVSTARGSPLAQPASSF